MTVGVQTFGLYEVTTAIRHTISASSRGVQLVRLAARLFFGDRGQ